MSKRKTIEDAQVEANKNGGKCLSDFYKSNKQKLLWECSSGHQWSACLNNIDSGYWCPECANVKKLSLDDCIDFASSKGGRCLSVEYVNSKIAMRWECGSGHVWTASFSQIKNGGTWCPTCSGKNKLSLNDCIEFAISKNGRCTSKIYLNTKTPMKWKCSSNHTWTASFSDIKSGHWCPSCAGVAKLGINDCINVACKNNGKCLSNVYKNNRQKLLWQCARNHIWEASFHNTSSGHWCPHCSVRKNQNDLANLLEKILNTDTLQNVKIFSWLKTSNGIRQEIDIWIPKFKLAIEYDGEQHFKPVRFSNYMSQDDAQKKLLIQRKNDKNKNRLIKKHIKGPGSEIKYFIRFSYKETLTEEYVAGRLIENGVLNVKWK